MASSHETQCKVCQHGPETIDWSWNNVAISQIVECSEASVRRHRDWMHVNGLEDGDTLTVTSGTRPEPRPGGTWQERRTWQVASGGFLSSYQFIPDGPAEVHIDTERIDRILMSIPEPDFPDVTTGPSEMLVIGDPQIGKANEEGGGTPETLERVYASTAKAVERYMLNPPSELFLIDGGDLIENLFSVPAQAATNDRTLPEQIEDAVGMYLKVIGMLLGYVGKLYHVTVTSNHGEARTAMKVNPYGSENDWGLSIQRMLKARCEDRGWDVEFIRPGHNEDTSEFTTLDGTKVAVNHGHHSGSPQKVKQWVGNQIIGQRPGWDADVWCLNHFHHDFHFPIGKSKSVFGTPANDPGSSWYTRKTGESSKPGLMALTLANGDWSNHSIL